MTLDELRRLRAGDMRAVLDAQDPTPVDEFAGVELRAASARELEWLRPEVALAFAAEARATAAIHATVGVVSPFSPSILVVTYTARYFLAHGATPAQGNVYLRYGTLQATELPVSRSFREL